MNKLFKNITIITNLIFAEFNREITENDYALVEESDIEVTDTSIGGGKIVRKTNKYKMNPQVVEELTDYVNKKRSTFSSPDATGWDTFVKRMSEFEIVTETIIDFRGSKTEQNKTDKMYETMQKVDMEHNSNVETIFPMKVSKLNEQIKELIGYENNIFCTETVKFLTKESTYQKEFDSNLGVKEFTEKSLEIKNKIAELNKSKRAVELELAVLKRCIVHNLLEQKNWNVKDENDTNVAIPEIVVEKVKEAIVVSFNENPIALIP